MSTEVRFFSAPYSRPNRSYPIGDLTKYLIHTRELSKSSPDMEQVLHVPEFDGWDTVNLIQFADTSYIYWVKSSVKRTDKSGQITFDLIFNPVTSLITEEDVLKGVWDRLPTNENPYLKEIINTDAMKITSSTEITCLPKIQGSQSCWYEIVLKQEIDKSVDGRLVRYGGFAIVPVSSANNYEEFILASNTTASRYRGYPSLHRIINEFGSIANNANTDKIVAVNVSLRCPYRYKSVQAGSGLSLCTASNESIDPVIYKETTLPSGADWVLYPIELTESISDNPSITQTITCTDRERKYGSFSLMDEAGIVIADIPPEYFIDNSLSLSITCTADYTGIYTEIKYNGGMIRVPEGKLPWVGNAWTDYQVRGMDSDRASMNLSIETAREQRNIDAMMSMSNAAMSGAVGFAMGGPAGGAILGLATAGMGIAGSYMQGQLSERTARSEQEIRERNQKQQLSNHFDTSYGLIYLLDYSKQGLRITKAMPMNLSEGDIDKHVDEFGYRVEGVRSVTVRNGRYQGRLIDIPIAGPKGDMLNAEFIEGVKLTMEEEKRYTFLITNPVPGDPSYTFHTNDFLPTEEEQPWWKYNTEIRISLEILRSYTILIEYIDGTSETLTKSFSSGQWVVRKTLSAGDKITMSHNSSQTLRFTIFGTVIPGVEP